MFGPDIRPSGEKSWMESNYARIGLHLNRNLLRKSRVVRGGYARFRYRIRTALKSRARRSAGKMALGASHVPSIMALCVLSAIRKLRLIPFLKAFRNRE